MAEAFALPPEEVGKLAIDFGVESQVILSAMELEEHQPWNPDWLWYDGDAGSVSLGRWPRETKAGAYVRLGMALRTIAALQARLAATEWSRPDIQVGSKIKFAEEQKRYTVQARSHRYAICTKPFNARHTVLYTIIDFQRGVRGRDNMIFGRSYETPAECRENLREMHREENPVQVSYRNFGPLKIESVAP